MKLGWTCQNCRFWEEIDSINKIGECHRNPPEFKIRKLGKWPWTRSIDWCGEFVAARINIEGHIE